MRFHTFFLILGLAAALISCRSSNNSAQLDPLEMVKTDVNYLASDSLEGRETGTKGEELAALYIASRFENLGLSPMGDSNTYFQFFKRKTRAHPHDTAFLGPEISGRNVVAFLDNNKENTIVIGAHYDHLGWGDQGSLHGSHEKAIHNGADDNASGVAAMLLLAAKTDLKATNNNYLFIAFSGEEKGLWGSNYFVKNPTRSISSINYMINMDMVGRLDSLKRLAIYGVGTSPSIIPALERIQNHGFTFSYDSSGVGPSDHTSFYLEDIPVIHFFTGQHAQYHKPTDDVQFINFSGIVEVADLISSLINQLNTEPKLTFQKTKDKENKGRNFKVTMGIIPDYLYTGKGLRIDGVKEDRPASKAGLLKGDIVLKMGDQEIQTMTSYMEALGTFDKGQTIPVIVLRKGVEVRVGLTFE